MYIWIIILNDKMDINILKYSSINIEKKNHQFRFLIFNLVNFYPFLFE